MAQGQNIPPRGFSTAEFENRLRRAQEQMRAHQMDALFLTTEPEIRYFSGFLTQFWQSPTRPWYMLVPKKGKPIAIIPEIGASYMRSTWLDDIRTWSSPFPADEGITLLKQALREVGGKTGNVGMLIGAETHLHMPYADFQQLDETHFVDATAILRSLRMVKSEAEIEKIAHICGIASDAFETLPEFVTTGDTEAGAFLKFKIDLLQRGADDVPYLVGGAGQDGYDDIISPPTEKELKEGDILMLDTGALFDGYFCDFDRNYAIGKASDRAKKAYETLYEATEAGIKAARPGVQCHEVFTTMWDVITRDNPQADNNVGRMGHGLGIQLTEPPSHALFDETRLEPGMVITLEPGLSLSPTQMMVHEEDVVIREDGAELLTRRAPEILPVIP